MVSNIVLTDLNAVDNHTLVQFDLSWENSWRIGLGPSNYDGAWVFIKFRENSGDWEHGTINYVDGTATSDGHTEVIGSTVRTTADGIGVFVYRSAESNGNVDFSSIQLRWNYGVDDVSDEAVLDVQVFAIEMVYIPEGTYPLGSTSAGSEVDHFYTNTASPGARSTYSIGSEGSIAVSSSAGELYYDVTSSGNNGDQAGPIPAAFPKGYAAFWMMKYEITEDQWICFFNSLTEAQKLAHDITDSFHKNTDGVTFRNTVAWNTGNATTSAPSRAINFLSYEDNAAYYDWIGLRFMTELEYEKSSKGPNHVNNMVASGGIDVFNQLYNIVNDGQENANISNPGENITNMNYASTDPGGPMRVGIFASSAVNPTRTETGGSYFGVMELSGNLYERCIGVGSPVNRAFTGNHGDGEILSSGDHNVTGWPAVGSEGAICYRGGAWVNGISFCQTSDRSASAIFSSITNNRIGARGVRTANETN